MQQRSRRGARATDLVQRERVHGEAQGRRAGAWEAVYRKVRRIPRGRVMTYGQVATLLGNRLSARAVGWALHGCPEDVPWHRVVNACGGCSTERLPKLPGGLQQALLEAEGVEFRVDGTLELERYRFVPRGGGSRPRRQPDRAARRSDAERARR